MASYQIGSFSFNSKQEATTAIKNVLKKNPAGSTLQEPDRSLLLSLIELHPDAKQKKGVGVDYISVEKTPPYNSAGFWIHRIDRTKTDFSYKVCLNGDSSPRIKFTSAARSAVVPDITSFRNAQFTLSLTVKCCMTGKGLSLDDCHVDHAPPYYFSVIVSNYISDRNIDISAIAYIDRGDGVSTVHFADDELVKDFREYHARLAKLRIVDKQWNIENGNRSKV
jgi:hypothetical protein